MKLKDMNTMTVRFACEYNELDALAEFLEKKAAEGWQLTSKTGVSLGFRRSALRKVRVSVELVYSDDNDYDNARFIEYCESAGWRHMFSDGKIQIFETDDLDATPIHTDPALKLAAVHRKAKKMNLWLPVIALFFSCLWMKHFRLNFDYGTLMSSREILAVFGMPFLMLVLVLLAGSYLHWYLKAKKAVADGQSPDYRKKRLNRILDKVILLYIFGGIWGAQLLDAYFSGKRTEMITTLALFAVILLFIILFPFFSARFGTARKGNYGTYLLIGIGLAVLTSAVTGVIIETAESGEYVQVDGSYQMVSLDELPLTMEDLGIETAAYADRYCDRGGTPFIRYMECDDFSNNEENYFLSYRVYVGNARKLVQWMIESRREFMEFSEIEDEGFHGGKTYISVGEGGSKENKWILQYGDRAIWINTNIPLSDSQKKIIREKLLAVK